jgi:hypothetical protein
MIFTPKNKPKIKMNVKIGKDMLKECKEITFLGVIIDDMQRFDSHFNKVLGKIKNGLNGLSMVKNQLNYKAKLNIYHALIHSHLSYCAMIWISSISKKANEAAQNCAKESLSNCIFKKI